jgi:hypothetical protein
MPRPADARDFLPVRRVAVQDSSTLGGALAEIRAGRLGGVLIEGVLDRAALQTVNDRLDAAGRRFPQVRLPGYDDLAEPPFLYGHSIVGAAPGLEAYHAAVAPTTAALEALFAGLLPGGFEAGLQALLEPLANTAVARAVGASGRPCAPATIRELPAGHQIALHIGNAFLCMPQAADLAAKVQVGAQLSWFLPLRRPEAGGELVVYDLHWDAVSEHYHRSTDTVKAQPPINHHLIELLPKVVLDPPAGSVLVFDGGRYFHRVRPVGGGVPRRTLGGFLAWSVDGQTVRYWS